MLTSSKGRSPVDPDELRVGPFPTMKKKTAAHQRPKRGERSGSSAPSSILILDERSSAWDSFAGTLRRSGHVIHFADNDEQALDELAKKTFELIVTHVKPGTDGIGLVKKLKSASPDTEVIVTTTRETMTHALRATKAGAYNYLVEPFHREELVLAVHHALERRRLTDRIRLLEGESPHRHPFEGIIFRSPSMSDLIKTVQQVARIDSPVLISGENGTGKELIARALHDLSPRRDSPLITVSCGVIPPDLQEVEIFGPAGDKLPNGARRKPGLFAEARGGSVFLDEVSELAPRAQAAMLRYLQNREVSGADTVGGRAPEVRVIAATKEELDQSVARGTFREDLYYRLNVIPIHIPPLRDRAEDIPLLAQRFVEVASHRLGIASPPAISPRVMSAFLTQPWPGNVRELECSIERAIALDRDGVIGMDDLPAGEPQRSEDKVIDRARQNSLTLSELEREYILEVLAECGGSRKRTAERLGITTATLWRKLKQYENRTAPTN